MDQEERAPTRYTAQRQREGGIEEVLKEFLLLAGFTAR